MHHEEATLAGHGGLRIYTQTWRPDEPTGTLVLSHGYAEHSGRYQHVAAALVNAGWAVLALDHRGHGRSEGRRALIDRLDGVVNDIDQLVDRAGAMAPGTRPVLLGHSMGGGMAAAYATQHQDKLSALVLSAPALGMRDTLPAAQRLAVQALAGLVPRLGTVALDASGVSRDPLVVSAYEADPLNYHGKVPAGTAREMLRASDLVAARGRALSLPVLIMIGSADRLVPLQGSQDLAGALSGHDVTLKVYDALYHEIFNEPEAVQVLADLVAWLDAHRPMHSGA